MLNKGWIKEEYGEWLLTEEGYRVKENSKRILLEINSSPESC